MAKPPCYYATDNCYYTHCYAIDYSYSVDVHKAVNVGVYRRNRVATISKVALAMSQRSQWSAISVVKYGQS